MPNKQGEKKQGKGRCQGWGERLGAGETQSWRDDTIFCSSRRFQLMTVCKQNVNAKDASKYIKGRERRINMFCCHFQERNGVPSSLPQQMTRKKKQTQITLIENPSRDYCVSQHILPPILAANQPSHLKRRWQLCSLLAPAVHGSWMACSQWSFAAGGGSNWQKLTVQMGIKFSLMFIICQKRIILCQSG